MTTFGDIRTFLVGVTGLEPATSRTPCVHSSQLSYTPTEDFAKRNRGGEQGSLRSKGFLHPDVSPGARFFAEQRVLTPRKNNFNTTLVVYFENEEFERIQNLIY